MRYTNSELTKFIKESFSLAQVLRKMGLRPTGGNYTVLKRKI
jgi:hypothetical protein